jgi:hypothetical protein
MDFEDRRIPVVTVIASPFVTLAQTVAKARGRDSLAMVVLPYSIANMPDEQARKLAEESFEAIVNALTNPAYSEEELGPHPT